MFAHEDIQLIQFLAHLAQIGVEIEVSCCTSTRTGETGGDILAVGGFFLMQDIHFVILPATAEVNAANQEDG
jgi:LmbE family N-acetylglucosaminyl deacetylase